MSPTERNAGKLDPAARIEPGRRLGRYRLCARIAGGGMGAVYLAKVEGPVGFDKLLALKIIHSHLAEDDEFVRMFLDEARIASRITHPNVCSVFDFGVEAGTYFIAMEYLLGETVAHIVKTVAKSSKEEPPSAGLAGYWCAIAAQAAEGLHAAHELGGADGELLGVVHRDVSPSNLFVGYDGHVQVMDFGIARAAGRLHVTQAGAIKGKLAYMAPEQLKRLEPDRRVDIWALGVVLWEMLTRQRLFRRDSEMDTMAAVANDPIEPPSSLVPGLPERIDEIVLRALARDREERYPTARALARDLHRAITALPEPVGVPDLADFLEATFAAQRTERLALVERARQIAEEALPETAARDRDEASSSVRVHEVHDLPTQVTPSGNAPAESGQRVAPPGRAESLATPAPRPAEVAPPEKPGPVAPKPAAVPIESIPPDPPEAFPDAATQAEKSPLGARARAFEPYRDAPSTVADGPLSARHRRVVIVAAGAALLLGIVLALSTGGDGEEDATPAEPTLSAATEPGAPREEARTATQGEPAVEREPTNASATARTTEEARAGALAAPRTKTAREPQPSVERTNPPAASMQGAAATPPDTASATRSTTTARSAATADPPSNSRDTGRRRETRTSMQAASPPATGVAVVIATGGWADVYAGDRRVGRTPARITLPAGRHILELRPGGDGAPVRRAVTVPANGETRLAVPIGQ